MGVAIFPAAGGGVNQYTQTFTSTGTWTAPSTCNSVDVFLVGGGGGGGSVKTSASAVNFVTGGAAGGGATVRKTISVTPGTTYTITIGAGGTGGTVSGNAGKGGDTTFGSLLTASGGGAGAGYDRATSTLYAANVNGGTGGGCAQSDSSYSQNAGWGGGSLVTSPVFFGTGLPSLSLNLGQPGTGSQGGSGTYYNSNPLYETSHLTVPYGLEFYGAAGNPFYNTNSPHRSITSFGATPQFGYYGGSSQGSNVGNSGSANTGAGGNGAAGWTGTSFAAQVSAAGGAGGSGYARIIYWA
jgi:hypothetical protein